MEIKEVEMYLEELLSADLGTNLMNADLGPQELDFVSAKSWLKIADHYV